MKKVLLVSGSRQWKDFMAIVEVLQPHAHSGMVFIHGGADGADALAARYLGQHGQEIHVPAMWKRGNAAGPMRNQEMVDLAAMYRAAGHEVFVFAFPIPNSPSKSSGTYGLIRMATKAGFAVTVTER